MLYLNRACFVFLIINLLFSCSPNKRKEDSITTKTVIDFASSKIGEDTYWKIYGMMGDSISNWEQNGLPSWKIDKSTVEFKIDSMLCINKKMDKVVGAHLGRQLLSSGTLDCIAYIYGVKIKGEWYFFSGPTMYVPRDKEHLNTPTSFTKLHEIGMDSVFKGYLKKNKKSGEWEINEDYFARFYERDAYNFPFTTQEAWEESWLKLMRENWHKRDTINNRPLQ